MKFPSTQNGFTLVELAIALMVIGLLIGGVLKGQELIENARVTSTIRQIKAYDAATLIFRNTYNALPGDIKRPNRIPNCTEAPCTIAGNGNGKIIWDSALSPIHIENYNFFPHLTKAGMIQGPVGGTQDDISDDSKLDLFFPNTSFDLLIGVTYEPSFFWGEPLDYAHMSSANLYRLPYNPGGDDNVIIPVKYMTQIDTKIDDGKPHSGDVQMAMYGDCPSVGYMNGTDENEYGTDSDTNVNGCPLVFKAEF